MIVGVDEVGRGAWAGPLAVGAVLLGPVVPEGLTDSKKLTKKQRERIDLIIRQQAKSVGIGWVSAKRIDQIGLSAALKLGARRALGQIREPYNEIIIDGTVALIEDPRVTTLTKADLLIPSVSAASIVAKVARDRYMQLTDTVYPDYKFASHVGYGTSLHKAALAAHGASPLHRLSFEPLREFRPLGWRGETAPEIRPDRQVGVGHHAEEVVSNYLSTRGHVVLARNWRTSQCEIDIVSRSKGKLYFTEVKYRSSKNQGGGFAAITPKKLRQMEFAARCYMHAHKLQAADAVLAAASVCGYPPDTIEFLELR